MTFRHVPDLPLADLSAKTTPEGRYYTTPDGNAYPSVTTILGKGSDNSWLKEWEERVGIEEVKRVSGVASTRGTAVHEIAELYLRNLDWKRKQMPVNIASFLKIKHHLDEHIGLIAGLELPLYSDKLRVAGRTDCIAKWNGEWAVIDFKTSKREKSREDITNYFLQASCYSYMFYERIGMIVPKLVIIMTVDDGTSIVFEERAKDHIKQFIALRESVDI